MTRKQAYESYRSLAKLASGKNLYVFLFAHIRDFRGSPLPNLGLTAIYRVFGASSLD